MCISRATVSAVSWLVVPAFICIDLLISLVLKIKWWWWWWWWSGPKLTEILHVFSPQIFGGSTPSPEFLKSIYKIRLDSDHVAKFQGDRSRDLGESVAKKKPQVKHKPVRNSGRPNQGGSVIMPHRVIILNETSVDWSTHSKLAVTPSAMNTEQAIGRKCPIGHNIRGVFLEKRTMAVK